MKSIENPSGFVFRPDAAMPLPGKKTEGNKRKTDKSFFSLLGPDRTEEKSLSEAAAEEESWKAETSSRLDEIHSLGQELMKRQSLDTIKAYKEAIKRFIAVFVARGIKVEEQVSSRNILNQKKYTILKVVDEKLENLVLGLLQTQVKQIDLLSKLEEIQGLLVDVLH